MSGLSSAVLIPVKAFADAKVRLAGALGPEERRRLARAMAEGVVRAAKPLPVAVVCDDSAVAEWAADLGAQVIWAPDRGLNAAVEEGVARLAEQGADCVTVVHADLPLVQAIGRLGGSAVVALAPDRRRDGTNVAAVPANAGFRFSYGPGSFARHAQEASRLGLRLEVIERADLAWDVDVPADLEGLTAGWR
ncbi:MAG TPA: 2-phospho-L-lactate guanylyltransferase [Acidimicrobiales bacterium]|nr:2-phospho-L-lactate guanylyltransferase [Acidimicrobiales bacterium]